MKTYQFPFHPNQIFEISILSEKGITLKKTKRVFEGYTTSELSEKKFDGPKTKFPIWKIQTKTDLEAHEALELVLLHSKIERLHDTQTTPLRR